MEKPTSVTIKVDEEQLSRLKSAYSSLDLPSEYHCFFTRVDGVSISVYSKTKNGLHKAVFQGEGAYDLAASWGKVEGGLIKKPIRRMPRAFFEQIGSDEVGTGDFFGPISVCAAYVSEKDVARLKQLGVADSKKMDDEYILEIGPTLVAEFEYSQCALDNEKYNEVNARGLNMNAIKAKMHNQVLLNLQKKHPNVRLCQDQFAEEKTYFKYLKDEKEIASPIIFSTKGEDAFLSVALASCIARYSFLKKMQALSKKYGVEIPFGGAAHVTRFATKFAKKYGVDELRKITKGNFKNLSEVLSNI